MLSFLGVPWLNSKNSIRAVPSTFVVYTASAGKKRGQTMHGVPEVRFRRGCRIQGLKAYRTGLQSKHLQALASYLICKVNMEQLHGRS